MRRAIPVLCLLVVCSLGVVPTVLADPGGGGAAGLRGTAGAALDLGTRASIGGYLASIGIDPGQAVFQQGLRNYAGPDCPGRGWTCTTARGPVVQMASGDNGDGGGDNVFVCQPAGPGTDPATNTCVIVQVGTSGTNRATCIEHDEAEEGTLSQSCSITQTSTTGRNFATVIQSIRMEAEGTSQDATQDSQVTQTSTSGANQSNLVQHIGQEAEDEKGASLPVEQTQEGHQDAGVDQTSTRGNNTSFLSQSIVEKAEAENSPSITQSQNTANTGPNSDAEISQNSDLTNGGKNLSWLHQVNLLIGDAESAATAIQNQGSTTGGLEGTVNQFSSRPSQSFNREIERQILDAEDVISLSQTQIDPKRCCSEQQNNPNNVFDIDQVSVQEAGDNAFQQATAFGDCDTSGNCTVDQSQTQNGQTDTNSCSGSSCHEAVQCFTAEGGEQFCTEPSPID